MKSFNLFYYHKASIVGWVILLFLVTYITIKISALYF